jgi:hypothetical protein
MASEKIFETRVKKWLAKQGIYAAGTPKNKMEVVEIGWFFKVWGGGYQKSGIPDLLMCVNGFFISVELKAAQGTASELQKLNVARINATGGIGIILYPNGFEEFKEIVKGVIECSSHIAALNVIRNVRSSSGCVIWMG